MEEGKMSDKHLTSAAAFVEGGIQDACDDACSICLDAFCDNNPSTLTTCKHEFHLQCILEWCQRSSQCPMCWQSISLKDPSSQELLDAVEHERNIRMNPPRNTTTIFHHPTLGDFELQHLPVSATESELEERIIQHLAAAAAMGRARQLARREGQRGSRSSSTQGRPQFLVFSTHPNGASTTPAAATMIPDNQNSPFITVGEDSAQLIGRPSSVQADQVMALSSGSSAGANQQGTSLTNRTSTSPNSQDRAGPSDLQSFTETVKSRFSALSTRYKESITKSTRGWKERLFARNNTSPDSSAEGVRREADHQGTAATVVTRMMDHLEIGEDGRRTNVATTVSNNTEDNNSTRDLNEHQTVETAPCATTSAPSN
ncbi:hypothetical protein RD792_003115 [Penstemon davidsonii]|uniref:RING-type E3 ubiquitin transferase n=1 Tax=Penstemon davidsonii TaxID=160366 RepID=A0ABR0DSW1_9LAMI|nr:hypothetical protein RD792_003104 [Penstemon davidsonii]KAK4492312.1 hypothetical protein RD792_003115 [Penstemon davidsonii]